MIKATNSPTKIDRVESSGPVGTVAVTVWVIVLSEQSGLVVRRGFYHGLRDLVDDSGLPSLQRPEKNGRCSSIHGWLVRRVVFDVVMINSQVVLKRRKWIRFSNTNSF